MTKKIGCICIALGLLATMADTAEAQFRRPFQFVPRVNRVLGVWNGPGYHTYNPGPDSSYYNPWSQTNSKLISNSPEFLARFGHEINPTPMDLLRSGTNAFGQPFGGTGQGEYVPSATPFSADFVPNNRREEEEPDTGFDDEDLDEFGDDEFESSNDELEDRFDEEADSFEQGGDAFDEDVDSSGGQREAGSMNKDSDVQDSISDDVDEDATTFLLEPGGLFLPASHGN